MYKHVCDICKEKSPDAKIKYKYRAKRFWYSLWYESGMKISFELDDSEWLKSSCILEEGFECQTSDQN